MDPITPGIISGLLASGLYDLTKAAATGPTLAQARPPKDLHAMLTAPASQRARKLSATDPARQESLGHFLRSDDIEALVKRVFQTRATPPDGDGMAEIRELFRELYAWAPGLAGGAERADALFHDLPDACAASIQAAIDHNVLAGLGAMSALKHLQTWEKMDENG